MGVDRDMREFWSISWAFVLAIAVHVLMAAAVVLGTITWKPFKPPALTGMTIEAVIVDTGVIKQRREQARLEADRAIARKAEQDRREQELKARQKDLASKKRDEDLRLQKMRKQQEQDRRDLLKKQQNELEQVRKQRDEATRQRIIQEQRLKQLDARRQAEADAQRQARDEADLRRQMANEQTEFRAGQLATKGDEYYGAIQSQVTNNWLRPPTARSGLRCRLKIVQIPGGEVISAAIAGTCNADEATRRSLVAAVERTGTLPYRGFEDVFQREIDFLFRYDDN